jgi:hypothetical protein
LGERLLCKQEVIGSIPFTSTISRRLMVPDSGNSVTARGVGACDDENDQGSISLPAACVSLAGSLTV